MLWETLYEDRPSPRAYHSACDVGDRIIIFGGEGERMQLNDVHILDTNTLQWRRCITSGTPPSRRGAHTATVMDNNFITIFGGYGLRSYKNDLHILNIATNPFTWSQPTQVFGRTPPPRKGHTAVSLSSNTALIFGGLDRSASLNDTHLLTRNGDEYFWKELDMGTSPEGRGFATATLVGNTVFLFGGFNRTTRLNDSWMLDTETWKWIQLETNTPPGSNIISNARPYPRQGHVACAISETEMLIFGGYGEIRFNDIWILDTETHQWKRIKTHGTQPTPRSGLTACKSGPTLLLYGGFDGAKHLTETVRLYIGYSSSYRRDISNMFDQRITDYEHALKKTPIKTGTKTTGMHHTPSMEWDHNDLKDNIDNNRNDNIDSNQNHYQDQQTIQNLSSDIRIETQPSLPSSSSSSSSSIYKIQKSYNIYEDRFNSLEKQMTLLRQEVNELRSEWSQKLDMLVGILGRRHRQNGGSPLLDVVLEDDDTPISSSKPSHSHSNSTKSHYETLSSSSASSASSSSSSSSLSLSPTTKTTKTTKTKTTNVNNVVGKKRSAPHVNDNNKDQEISEPSAKRSRYV